MFAASLRFILSVIFSPRRLLIAALLATFCYAAVVATKARLFPEPAVRAAKAASAATTERGDRGPSAPGRTRGE
jgi:hypothetical protein